MVNNIVPLINKKDKEFLKDYSELTWELEAMDDGSIWLTNAQRMYIVPPGGFTQKRKKTTQSLECVQGVSTSSY